MKRFKLLISTVIVLSVLVSCAKVTEEETPWQLKSLPVVFSVITPSQPVRVSLSKTVVKGELIDTMYYPAARVLVCGDDKNWIELTRQSKEKAIYSDVNNAFDVREGETCYLRVELPDKTITAQTTVPMQKSVIESEEYIVDADWPENLPYYMGTFKARLKLYENTHCLLIADSRFIGDDNSTFLQTEHINSRFSLQGRVSSFDLKLISLDPYFAKYWAAKEISVMQNHYEGDMTVFIGTYNGLLPPYSNIVNGVGLFGSYVMDTKTVTITQP